MPPLRAWAQFIMASGSIIGLGVLGLKFLTPSDEELVASFSPELREKYRRELEFRQEFEKNMRAKIQEQSDKPAWLQGTADMVKLDAQVAKETRDLLDKKQREGELQDERERLAKLAEREKKI